MKLFVITTDMSPDFFYKAHNQEESVAMFCKGLTDPESFTEHYSFKVRELTLDLLMELAPSEFCITRPFTVSKG